MIALIQLLHDLFYIFWFLILLCNTMLFDLFYHLLYNYFVEELILLFIFVPYVKNSFFLTVSAIIASAVILLIFHEKDMSIFFYLPLRHTVTIKTWLQRGADFSKTVITTNLLINCVRWFLITLKAAFW